MFTEIKRILRDKKVEGFTLVENTGVSLLEDTLGIRFPIKPVAIPLTPENKQLFYNKAFFNAAGREILDKIATLYAYYEPDFGAYFFNPIGDNNYISAHENMHGFTEMINPHIADAMVRSRDPEKKLAVRCFSEGIAEWAAIEALYRSTNEADKQEAVHQQELKVHGRNSRRNFIARNFGAVTVSLIGKHISQIDIKPKSILGKIGQRVLKTGSAILAEYNFLGPQYIVGYYFVSHAMHVLVDNVHMTVPEAMKFLIKNPPIEISHLRRPDEYVAFLLQRPLYKILSPLRRNRAQATEHIHAIIE